MKLSAVRVDLVKIEQGVWLEAGMFDPRLHGIQIKVRGFGNSDDQRIQDEEREKLPVHLKVPGATLPETFHPNLMNRRLSEAVLVDWRGVEGDDGQPLECTPETVLPYLENPEYKILREILIQAGSTVAQGASKSFEADVGNSAPASSGSSPGASTSKLSSTSRKKR